MRAVERVARVARLRVDLVLARGEGREARRLTGAAVAHHQPVHRVRDLCAPRRRARGERVVSRGGVIGSARGERESGDQVAHRSSKITHVQHNR